MEPLSVKGHNIKEYKFYLLNFFTMSMTMKRNWHLIVIAVLFLLVLCYFGTNRVISVNISNKGEIKANHPIVNQK